MADVDLLYEELQDCICKKGDPSLEITISRNYIIRVSSMQYAEHNTFVPFPSEVWPQLMTVSHIDICLCVC